MRPPQSPFASNIRPFVAMRIVKDPQFKLGEVPIGEIVFNPKSRDDVPAVLRGLQHRYCDPATRKKIFEILEENLCPDVSHRRGRPSMSLWRIFVLGVLQRAIDCDFDRLVDYANNHKKVRQMLGHADFGEKQYYQLQTVMDNVSLLTEEILEDINHVVVASGHRLVKKKGSEAPLRCRADSSVAKTHVHWPTDVSLLWDAIRCLIRTTSRVCQVDLPHFHGRLVFGVDDA